jgi:CubicO group peptidase (beta-lactamase class C family)
MTKRLFNFANTALIVALSVCLFACNKEESRLKAKLENTIEAYKSNHSFNAIYDISHENDTIIRGANGFFDIENHKVLSPDIRMAIASGTKQMTAAAILKLQEAGKLNVNDVVAKHLKPDSFYFQGGFPEWADKVTIHQLLTHTSGIPDYIFALKLDMTMPHKDINKSIAEFAIKQPLMFNPGEGFKYSNTGYVILGLIIEELSGKDLRTFFKEELFEPLDMKNTELATLEEALDFQYGRSKEYPNRYIAIPTGDKPMFKPIDQSLLLAPFADGGVISNLDDLRTWNHALHNGKVLSAESYKLMTTPYAKAHSFEGYESHVGYGIYVVEPPKGEKFYMHAGNAIGIRGEYIYIPAQKLAISIISNVYVYEPEELKGKINYTETANQIDIRYFMNALLHTVHE